MTPTIETIEGDTESEMTDEDFNQMMDEISDLAAEKIDEILDDANSEDLPCDLVMHMLWMYSTRYLAISGWTTTELQADVAEYVEHQTSQELPEEKSPPNS